MAATSSSKKSKKGRDAEKCKRYRLLQVRERRKIVKIAKSSGVGPAMIYAREHGLSDFARKRLGRVRRWVVKL